jgi:acylphosphatase
MIARKIIFTGKVQGVSFRHTTEKIAQNFKVCGYVKNLLKNGAPYSGNQVELFLQGEKPEIDAVIKLVSMYFGQSHIVKTDISTAKVDKKLKDFHEDRTEDALYWKNNPVMVRSQSDFGFGYKSQQGAVLPFKGMSPVEKECEICHFMTGRRCPDCGSVVCGLCFSSGKHTCKNIKHVKYDVARFHVLNSSKLCSCTICDKTDTTLQCKTCGQYICSKCGPSHICQKEEKKGFKLTSDLYLCSVCKKGRTHCQCNSCKRAVCQDCQGNHDCTKKADSIPAPVKDKFEYEYINTGNCVVCNIKTTRICKDCGKPLCNICNETIIDTMGNSLHDCQNRNIKKGCKGFVQSVRAALGF